MIKKMSILVLLLLLLPPGSGNGLGYVFYTGSDKKNWTNAQAYCRTHHNDLVTIRDAKESEYYCAGAGWIGLYREDKLSPWKWSRGDKIANFTIWSDDPFPPGNCAYKYSGTEKWEVHECNIKHSFMCSVKKLLLVKENKTWEEALDHCRSLERLDPNLATAPYQNYRYDLATLITWEDHVNAREHAQEATTKSVWTGLHHLAGQWIWVSGEPVKYERIPNCPNSKFCGVLDKNGNGTFKIRNCNRRRNFLCYKRP